MIEVNHLTQYQDVHLYGNHLESLHYIFIPYLLSNWNWFYFSFIICLDFLSKVSL